MDMTYKDLKEILTNKYDFIIRTLNQNRSSSSSFVTNFTSECDWLVDVMWLHSKHIIGPYKHTHLFTDKYYQETVHQLNIIRNETHVPQR